MPQLSPEWQNGRLMQAYREVDKALHEIAPATETHLHAALHNALSNIEYADELLAKGGKAALPSPPESV